MRFISEKTYVSVKKKYIHINKINFQVWKKNNVRNIIAIQYSWAAACM